MKDRLQHTPEKKSPSAVLAEERRQIIVQLRTASSRRIRDNQSRMATLLFLVCQNANGNRLGDFAHVRWDGISIEENKAGIKDSAYFITTIFCVS